MSAWRLYDDHIYQNWQLRALHTHDRRAEAGVRQPLGAIGLLADRAEQLSQPSMA